MAEIGDAQQEHAMSKISIIVMGVFLIIFVLVGSLVLQSGFSKATAGYTSKAVWTAPVAGSPPDTLKAIDLNGDGKDEVFVQTTKKVVVLSDEGKELFSFDAPNGKSTMGDLDGDGVDEIVIAVPQGNGMAVTAFDLGEGKMWSKSVSNVGQPTRGLSIDFDGDQQRELVFGTDKGILVCLEGKDGRLRWQYSFPGSAAESLYVRGTDDVVRGKKMYLAAAVRGGQVVLLDGRGKKVWGLTFPEQVRRLRATDLNGDGVGEILLGGWNGKVWLISAQDAGRLWETSIGSRVNEARFLELDGNPTAGEVVVGGKNGGVLVFNATGGQLWRNTVTGKVREFAAWDFDEDGNNELLVAADRVSLMSGQTGKLIGSFYVSGPTTLDTGDFGKKGTYLVGLSEGVAAMRVERSKAMWCFSPIIGGLVISLIIAVTVVVLTRIDWGSRRPQKYVVQDLSPAALRARKRFLRESLQDLKRLQTAGRITPEAYLAQSRELREQLASIEEQLLKVQPDYKPELMRCPACGAPVDIGADRCPYCNHVLI